MCARTKYHHMLVAANIAAIIRLRSVCSDLKRYDFCDLRLIQIHKTFTFIFSIRGLIRDRNLNIISIHEKVHLKFTMILK